jgi:hypothetical protein
VFLFPWSKRCAGKGYEYFLPFCHVPSI